MPVPDVIKLFLKTSSKHSTDFQQLEYTKPWKIEF